MPQPGTAQMRPLPNAGTRSLALPATEEMNEPAVRDFTSGEKRG